MRPVFMSINESLKLVKNKYLFTLSFKFKKNKIIHSFIFKK